MSEWMYGQNLRMTLQISILCFAKVLLTISLGTICFAQGEGYQKTTE